MDRNLLTVGYHKGEMDFGISGEVGKLSIEQMASFRKMIVVAIGISEDMWRRERQNDTGEQNKRKPSLRSCVRCNH